MTNRVQEIEKKFLSYVKKMNAYNEAVGLMYWDLRTGAPKKGVEQRSEVIGLLFSESFKMSTSDEIAEYISFLLDPKNADQISEITRKTAEDCKKEYDRMKKIPLEKYQAFITLRSKSGTVWEEAKEKQDFSLFKPYLEQMVTMMKELLEYWGYEGNKYNTLLDMYEPGLTVDVLDPVFSKLRDAIVPLIKKINDSPNSPDLSFVTEFFPKEKQREFALQILKEMDYDFDAGRLDESVHPFATGLNPGDVRITTNYNEEDFRVAVFGTIHECGHALYEQNISKELIGTTLASGTSMGIHESQSLFNEMIMGRSKSFWKKFYPLLKEYSPYQFNNVSLDDFYHAINEVKPSFIRIEADELTYPLHIIIRYEIEKALFNDEIKVADLPKIWNEKYKEYLGIEPRHDSEGVLQDVHWSEGLFGYFPSYALGLLYAAQFKQALLKDYPNFEELLEAGNLTPIREWFTEKVHKHGKMKKPLEILQETTGEGLNPEHLINYYENKYQQLYRL